MEGIVPVPLIHIYKIKNLDLIPIVFQSLAIIIEQFPRGVCYDEITVILQTR